jgi:hypothetical protein
MGGGAFLLINLIGGTIAAIIVSCQLGWYIWKLSMSGWGLDRGRVMPLVGLVCGLATLAAVVAYARIGWTEGPASADRVLKRSPFLIFVATDWVFTAMTIGLFRGATGPTDGEVSQAVTTALARHPNWVLIGFVIGLLSVPPFPLRPFLPSALYILILLGTAIIALIEAIVVLGWLLGRLTHLGQHGYSFARLLEEVPAIGWGGVIGCLLAACTYYILAAVR